jgi:acyl carrier protein
MEQETRTGPPVDAGLRQQVIDSMGVLLPRVLRREVPAVSLDTKLMEELGLTSSSTLELLLELEEELQIQINVEDVNREDFGSVGTLAEFIAGHTLPVG